MKMSIRVIQVLLRRKKVKIFDANLFFFYTIINYSNLSIAFKSEKVEEDSAPSIQMKNKSRVPPGKIKIIK